MKWIVENTEFIHWVISGCGLLYTFFLYIRLKQARSKSEIVADTDENEARGKNAVNEQMDKMMLRLSDFAKENDNIYELLSQERKSSSGKDDYINRLETACRRVATLCLEYCPNAKFCQEKVDNTFKSLNINLKQNDT